MTLSLIATVLSTLYVTVSNPLPEQRDDVPVVLEIPASVGDVRSVKIAGPIEIKYQLDDMDDDGRADELVLMLDMKARETRVIKVDLLSSSSTTDFETGTHAYMKLHDKDFSHPAIVSITYPGNADNGRMYNSLYGHGAVLEGLYNAIRVYMDNRQSVDLYAKNKPQLELETTGFYTTLEQLDKGYGRDILWVGSSISMGGFRGWQNDSPTTIDSVATRSQRVVTTGPLRSVIEVCDKGWSYKGRSIDMVQRYSVFKGHRDYDVEISLKGAPVDEIYATGVQKIMNDNEGFIRPDGLAGSWGNNVPDGNNPHLVDTLGLGISVSSPYLVKTLVDDVNYLTLIKADSKGKIKYNITAGAVRDECSPHDSKAWFDYLVAWRRHLDNPVKVQVLEKSR